MAPLRTDGLLNAVGHGDAVLADHVLELKRLPTVRIGERDPRLRDDERRVDRFVVRIRVSVRLIRPVGLRAIEESLRNPVSDRSG